MQEIINNNYDIKKDIITEELLDDMELALVLSSERMEISPAIQNIISRNIKVASLNRRRATHNIGKKVVGGTVKKGISFALDNFINTKLGFLDKFKDVETALGKQISRRDILQRVGREGKDKIRKEVNKMNPAKLTSGDKSILGLLFGIGMTEKEKQVKMNRRQFLKGMLSSAVASPNIAKGAIGGVKTLTNTTRGIVDSSNPLIDVIGDWRK